MRRILVAVVVVAVVCATASALSVGAGDLTGSRSVENGLTGGGLWGDTFKISWEIYFDDETDLWCYEYRLSTLDDEVLTGETSHIILEVSQETFDADDLVDLEGSPVDEDGERWWGPSYPGNSGNPGLVVDFFGLKFGDNVDNEDDGEVFSFCHPNGPMWGDLYSKNGNAGGQGTNYVYNIGIGTDPTDDDSSFTNWIAVPDTTNGNGEPPAEVIPEPTTLALVGLGLIGLASRRKKRA